MSEDARVADFLQDKRLLIVDPSSACRNSIENTFKMLGAKKQNIFNARTFAEGKECISMQSPDIIVSEYKFDGGKSGFDLLNEQSLGHDGSENIFIMITSTVEESVIAEAAEGEIDAFITKPFSPAQLTKYILQAVMLRVDPPKYIKLVEKGQNYIQEKNFDKAIEILTQAKEEEEKTSLANYYLGFCHFNLEAFEKALAEYEEGLRHNELHYKCLRGKFEVLNAMDNKKLAYSTGKKISENFPLTPSWMSQILQLSVFTANFSDVSDYYEKYKALERRTPQLTTIMSAALVASGKFLAKDDEWDQAIANMHAATVVSGYNPRVIETLVDYLVKRKANEKARGLLKKCPPDMRTTKEFKSLEFSVNLADGMSPEQVISAGKPLMDEGAANLKVFTAMLEAATSLERDRLISSIGMKALQAYPESKETFSKYRI